MVLSLDLETYGSAYRDEVGRPLPSQSVFHPARSLHTDGVSLENLILTCAITPVEFDPCTPSLPSVATLETPRSSLQESSETQPTPTDSPNSQPGPWRLPISNWKPSSTRVFRLDKPQHLRHLRAWVSKADLLVGMNLGFDLLYLTALPAFQFLLAKRPRLVDLSVVNYLHSEVRPERSLKSIGTILGLFNYDEEVSLKSGHRYVNPGDPDLHWYNACDTHNTILAISELARRIERDYPGSPKLSPTCLQHYSNSLWTAIGMARVGIPLHLPSLLGLERTTEASRLDALAKAAECGLILESTGSDGSKRKFLNAMCDEVDASRPNQPTIRSDKRLQKTKKKKELSLKDENRHLLSALLPSGHPMQAVVHAFNEHSRTQKLLSSYIFPIARHARTDPTNQKAVAIPTRYGHRLYPTWYVVPTTTKDTTSDRGGTEQGRITCKFPAAQTFPKEIKACIKPPSPFHSIVWLDLSQIELRVAALLSRDAYMTKAFINREDQHSDRIIAVVGASRLIELCGNPLNKKNELFNDTYRQAGKVINFADLFLSSPPTMRGSILRDLGIDLPLSIFEKIVADRPTVRPGLWAWQQELIAKAKREHRLELPILGQSRFFPGPETLLDEVYMNTIVNCPVQTWAGNIMLNLQHLIGTRLPPPSVQAWAYQFVNIYDAVGLVCLKSRVPELQSLIAESFHDLVTNGYWAMLQALQSHSLPLEYDLKVQD